MKIDPKNGPLVEACRKEITRLSNQQDIVYRQMTDIMGQENDFLWDYCFNCQDENEYTKRAREELYDN